VFSGVADLKKAFDAARSAASAGRGTLLFVDEIHRFNRAQQDGFLPVCRGRHVTWSAPPPRTRPSSSTPRCCRAARCWCCKRSTRRRRSKSCWPRAEEAEGRAAAARRRRGARGAARMADGDGRYLLNLAEELFALGPPRGAARRRDKLALRAASPSARRSTTRPGGALQPHLRAAQVGARLRPDAALYWLARMLDGGEDPLYIARRLVRFAVEDIGLADPQALPLASPPGTPTTFSARRRANWRWRRRRLSGTAPKSNAVYKAFGAPCARRRSSGS
jgi:putative ATPase